MACSIGRAPKRVGRKSERALPLFFSSCVLLALGQGTYDCLSTTLRIHFIIFRLLFFPFLC
jgi:hypothetical protein